MEEIELRTYGEAPHTLKSPRLLRSLVSASRSRRFPATKKTEDLLLGILLPEGLLDYNISIVISQNYVNNIIHFCNRLVMRMLG